MVQEGQCTDSCSAAAYSAQQQAYAQPDSHPSQLVAVQAYTETWGLQQILIRRRESFKRLSKELSFQSVCSSLLFPL